MSFKKKFTDNSVESLLKHVSIVLGVLLFFAIAYFYIYLPQITNHGETVKVPDLKGVNVEKLKNILKQNKLRFQVNDSSYNDSLPPLSVIRQFPFSGSKVKPNRIIYVSLNRVTAPTVPVPDLIDGSEINAKAVLKSNELRLGKLFYVPDPFGLVKEIKFKGKKIIAGVRLPKGAVIDLVIGDGLGAADDILGNLVGDEYPMALKKLLAWNLHLGAVEMMKGADTTDVQAYVYKQYPNAGDSVRMGTPVTLWIAEKGYRGTEK